MTRRPAVFTIAPGVSFADAVAGRVLAEATDPLTLARATILLPTRRSCRALQEAFLRRSEGRPLLLPRLLPLGDLDSDELELAGAEESTGEAGTAALELPPAIPALRRQLLLARAIRRAAGAQTPIPADQAVRLAAALGGLLDRVQTEQLGFDRLADIVPAEFAQHWQETLDFLSVLTRIWPDMLAAEGCVDPAIRRNMLLAARAERWRASPPSDPVIAAGSTGTIPATAALLGVVCRLPRGRVVLPGLDRFADDRSWAAIREDPSHPQHGMALLLERLGVERADVLDWPCEDVPATPPSRARIVAEALRPASTTDLWRDAIASADRERLALALRGVTRVDCPGPQEEAGVIALMLREALETPGKRAALVTPDRQLARRVAAELARWDIRIDDSAGRKLEQTPPGAFLRLTAAMLAEQLAPVPLLAALKHPLAAGGRDPAAFRRLVRRLESKVLRGPRPAPGYEGLLRRLETASDDGSLRDLVMKLSTAAGPLAALMRGGDASLAALLAAHVAFAEALAATDRESGAARLWAGDAGEAAAGFVADLGQAVGDFEPLPGERYPALLDAMMGGLVVRPRYGGHPRLAIWGPLEARLQQVDLLILGSLNEGTWPPEAATDPWLSRPMQKAFGLPAPERRIGLSAHDFAQAFCAPEVVLTRSSRVEGTPMVASRWLLRLETVLRALGLELNGGAGRQWLAWAKALDRPNRVAPHPAPAPRPPVAARPRRLSVTQIETWMRDPYAIYARRVLGLRALEPVDAQPGAADRGVLIHAALAEFLAACPGALGPDALDRLLAIGRKHLGVLRDRPGVWAFWWPRFVRMASWFVAMERERRTGAILRFGEVSGRLTLAGPAGPFELTAKADRIDAAGAGLEIIDYKTGSLPSPGDIERGYAPQLPLEAAIAAQGGFEGVAVTHVAALEYWRLTGADPAGEIKPLDGDPAALAAAARSRLEALVATYDDPTTPYLARPIPVYAPRYSDYEHLARVKEWSAGVAEESE